MATEKDIMSNDVIKQAFDNNVNKISCIPETIETIEVYDSRLDEKEMQRMPPPPKGVMGVTPAIVGSVEATEVLKIICDFGDVLAGELWTIDLRTWQSNKFSL